jgi:hypothetical protein
MKKLYKQFNDLKIDEDIQAMPVSELEKARVKKTVMKRKNKKHLSRNIAVAAVIFVASTISLSAAYPSFAFQLPLIGNVFSYFTEQNKAFEKYNAYSTDIGKTKESNGISVTITKAVYDRESIAIAYLIESEKNLGGFPTFSGQPTVAEYKNLHHSSSVGVKKISKNQYAGLYVINLKDSMPIDKINVNWDVDAIQNLHNNEISTLGIPNLKVPGDWSFDFSLHALETDSILFSDISTQKQGVEVKLNKITTTPISSVLYLSHYADQAIRKNSEHVGLTYLITDNLGNKYEEIPAGITDFDAYSRDSRIATEAFDKEATSITITPEVRLSISPDKIKTFKMKPIKVQLP